MCTGFVKRLPDGLIYGFNLDIDPEQWNYDLYMNKHLFSVGITVGKTRYYTHGVNSSGAFSNLPYMNGDPDAVLKQGRPHRIDLLTDRYLRGQYSFADVKEILDTRTITNYRGGSMHSLLADAQGHVLLIEPGAGYREMEGAFAVIGNYPLLSDFTAFTPWCGKERYDRMTEILEDSGEAFSMEDGLAALEAVRAEGRWGTRVSFVYSTKGKTVLYARDGDFSDVRVHTFA